MSIKNFFVSIYETIKRKIISAYVLVNNWLVDTLTGEIIYDISNMDINPTFWDAVCRASRNVVLGRRAAHADTDTVKKRVIGAVIRHVAIGIAATGIAYVATLFGATFISEFLTTVIAFYGIAFMYHLVLELIKNHLKFNFIQAVSYC